MSEFRAVKVRPKAEPRDAWQYSGTLIGAPAWVRSCCEYRGGPLLLVRRSGAQAVELTDWLVRDLDGEPEWLTAAEMQKNFERIAA